MGKETNLSFAEAYAALQEGKCVRRAKWLGYWVVEDGDVVMHCKDGNIVRMSKGCDSMFTLSHTIENDWLIVDEKHREELDKITGSRVLNPVQTVGCGG